VDRLRIMLVEDHVLLREALKLLLNAQPDLQVVAEAGTAELALARALEVNAQIILLDITLPDRSGISLLPDLRERCPSSRVIVLSMHEESEYLRSALAAGASGYIVKTSPSPILLDAIHSVQRGVNFIDPMLGPIGIEPAKPSRMADASPVARLSDRERQVLRSLAQGMRYQTIADKMGVSVKTVETYRSRLTAKLGFTNRADLIRFAIEMGILSTSAE